MTKRHKPTLFFIIKNVKKHLANAAKYIFFPIFAKTTTLSGKHHF